MKTSRKDMVSTGLAIIGAVVVFAKLQSYSWWLIGSWKGALGVLAVLGLGILLSNFVEVFRTVDMPSFLELTMWVAVATVVIASLFSRTTKAEFLVSAAFIGAAYAAQLTRHVWRSTHRHHEHYLPA